MKLAVSILFVFYYLQNYTESTTLGGNTVSRKGVAITGDILGTPFKTKNDECNKQCLNMHSCVYWSKQTRGIEETCSLHGPSATLYRPSIWVSGKITRTTREGTSTKEEGVVYISHRLVAISNTSDEECVDHCLKRQDCVYWSKITGEGTTCQLDGINATRYNVPIWVSGKITRLTDVGTPIAVTTQERVYYVSHELASFVNTNFHDCYIHCLYRNDCMYWARQTGADDLCKLYGPNAEQQNQTDWVSGVITRSTSSVYCIETSTRYVDDNFKTKKVSNTDECHSYCKNTENCVYWSKQRGQGEQDCFLSGPKGYSVAYSNFVAGAVNCTTPGGSTTIKEGVFYLRHKLAIFGLASDDECNKYCVHRKNCAYWSKQTGERKICELFNSDATQHNQANWVSGKITRSTGFFDCIEGSARYIEDDLNMMKKTRSIDGCHSYCENTANCVYWSRHIGKGRQDCFLSGLFAKKVTDENFIAGVINCPTPGGSTTIQEGVLYTDPGFGRPFLGRKFKHTNNDECINICFRRQDCAFWSKRIGEDETCVVYQSSAVKIDYPRRDFVSGAIRRSSEKTRTTTSADLHSTTLSSYSTTT